MKIIPTAYKYLKKYPMLSASILFSTVAASVFDGASFGMLIPLIKCMTNAGNPLAVNVPFLDKLGWAGRIAGNSGAISLIFVLLFLLIVAKNIFTYISNILTARLRFGTARDLSVNLINNLVEYDIRFFDNAKTGHIISTITNETRRMGDFVLGVLSFINTLARITAYTVLLFLIAWKASLAMLAMVLVVLAPLELIMKRLKTNGVEISRALGDYNFKLIEILSGIRLIKICGTEESERCNFKKNADELYRSQYKSNKYIFSLIPISEISIFALIVLSFLAMINVMKVDIAVNFPFIATYLVVLAKLLSQLNPLNSTRSNAINNLAAFENYEQLYNAKDKKTIESGGRIIDKFSGAIEFEDVSFHYSEGKEVLKGISFSVPKGKITAIVGVSGVGKSTLINLMTRFYDIRRGRITVDGIDLKELDLEQWRKKVGLVSQDIFVFNSSVRDNIAYGNSGIPQDKIVAAAIAANAHEFINSLPKGYDTILGERGVRLSGGQKQRISIARAILHNPEILILDEATSSLDTETEKLINDAIDRLTKDRTVVAIAHRLSTVAHADSIVVLDAGRIVERGSHHTLMEKRGLYKRLYDAQFNLEEVKGKII